MSEDAGGAEPLIYQLVDLTMKLATTTNALISDVLNQLDLTHALANALWQLGSDAPPTMGELAQRLRCDPSTVTFLADRLALRELAVRAIDPANRRVRTLVLTDKGRQVRSHLVDAMTRRTPMARLSPAEQEHLLDLLSKATAGDAPTFPVTPPEAAATVRP